MNRIIIIGRLVKDPELRYSSNGLAIATGSVAINTGYGDKQKTDYFNIVTFNKNAENFANICKKGNQICVDGSAGFSEYEKDGLKIKNFQITVESFYLFEKKKDSSIDDLGF